MTSVLIPHSRMLGTKTSGCAVATWQPQTTTWYPAHTISKFERYVETTMELRETNVSAVRSWLAVGGAAAARTLVFLHHGALSPAANNTRLLTALVSSMRSKWAVFYPSGTNTTCSTLSSAVSFAGTKLAFDAYHSLSLIRKQKHPHTISTFRCWRFF